MRKLFVFLLAASLCSFAACSNASDNTSQPTNAPTTAPTTEPTAAPVADPTATPTTAPTDTPAPTEAAAEEIKVITIAEALELCGEAGHITTDRYYIRGTVETMINVAYGNMVVSDDTGSISVYGTYSADGSLKYSEMTDKAFEGDEVLLHCILQNYNGTKEVKNARLIEFKKTEVVIDESLYTDMSVAEARTAETGTMIKVDGVVARITYANGMIPNGFILVDDTEAIYVFDADVAQRVAVGNRITIAASKTWWILEKEQSSAEKFGYKGCCQLENATLVSNDEKTDNAFHKNWIQENTVKAMIENPVTNDITSTIFKVTALVKKVDGKGFVNYYFFDLDGETGSYTYTQCSGSDFSWLDEFDGKICTVYLSALNAKSTSSACVYRLLPIEVIDEGFVFDTANTAEHVVKYYGVGQFASSYSGNPETELITTVSSDLLGFENAALSYTSSNTSVVEFKETDGKLVMNCLTSGTATVTATCTYGDTTYSETVEITVSMADAVEDYLTVADAAKAAVNETITVKGIVGPSLVNKTGFYLIDESGVIAVTMDAAILEGLEIGHEVVLKGTRDLFTNGKTDHHGQTCITNCEVVANYYGTNEYSVATFDNSITLADFYNLDAKVDYTTTVYVLKATVNVVETDFYTNIELTNGDTKVSLYCANANQYNWLKEFAGTEVTLEIAPCNWNNKTYYRGCVLAVYTDNGKVVNNLNFQK